MWAPSLCPHHTNVCTCLTHSRSPHNDVCPSRMSLPRYEIDSASGVPFPSRKDNANGGAGGPQSKRGRKEKLYTPLPFMDIKCRDPHKLRDEMIAHLPNPRIKIWLIDDPSHACFGSYGLQAARPLSKDDLIGRYTGFIASPGNMRSSDIRGTYTVSHVMGGLVIDAFVHGNEIRFINDWHGIVSESKGSNCEISHGWCTCRKGDGCLQVGYLIFTIIIFSRFHVILSDAPLFFMFDMQLNEDRSSELCT